MTDHQSQDPQAGGDPPPPQGQPTGTPPPGQGGGMAQQPPVQDAGLQPPVANLLSYLFGFIGGLIVFLTQRDREVRFHAAQSILMSIGIFIVFIALYIVFFILAAVDPTGITALILVLINLILPLGVLALVIIMCVQGYQQKHVKLPIVGKIAENWAGGAITQ